MNELAARSGLAETTSSATNSQKRRREFEQKVAKETKGIGLDPLDHRRTKAPFPRVTFEAFGLVNE
jgi:hypothetical protein